MLKRKFLFVIAGLCILASVLMYFIGKNSSHLSELKDFWWMPLPLAAICYLLALNKKP